MPSMAVVLLRETSRMEGCHSNEPTVLPWCRMLSTLESGESRIFRQIKSGESSEPEVKGSPHSACHNSPFITIQKRAEAIRVIREAMF